ncbi:MAG TPA: molybdopterin molybdotransferase MoeA, partial [Tepidisphaeraceae bacterium]|nr:molybdopterin molybdotransferase MoeA [Tepidisphaeraceae bacterium]
MSPATNDDPDMPENELSSLLTVQQAIHHIDAVPVVASESPVRLRDALGLRLAQDVMADRDYPPFQKSLMDGYAIRSADLINGHGALRVIGQIAAGQMADRPIGAGESMAIMTGAPLPIGADRIVPVENVEAKARVGGVVRVVRSVAQNQYIAAQGSDCLSGKTILNKGTTISPAQIAVLASVGVHQPVCYLRPRVAVLGTGDEIVPVDQTPGPARIRDSNTPMLSALLTRLGCDVVEVGNVPDEPELIRDAIRRGMAHDALFITGGMSMGEFDYVPRILGELSVESKVTKLRIKPG